MACVCRASGWEALIRGIAQLHVGEATPAVTKFQPALRGFRSERYQGRPGRLRALGLQTRAISSSLVGRAEAVPEVEVRDDGLEGKDGLKDGTQPVAVEEERPSIPEDANAKKPTKARKANARTKTDNLDPQSQKKSKEKPTTSSKPKKHNAKPGEQSPTEQPEKKLEDWQIQKDALARKFPLGWMPRKRLSPDALAGIRALHAQFPDVYTTAALANKFEVSPEGIRRILKSRWTPSPEEEEERGERWHRRGIKIWERKAAMGFKPSRKWRVEGVRRGKGFYQWRKRVRSKVEEEESGVKELREMARAERAGQAGQSQESAGDRREGKADGQMTTLT